MGQVTLYPAEEKKTSLGKKAKEIDRNQGESTESSLCVKICLAVSTLTLTSGPRKTEKPKIISNRSADNKTQILCVTLVTAESRITLTGNAVKTCLCPLNVNNCV